MITDLFTDMPPQADGYMLLFRNTKWEPDHFPPEELQKIMDSVMGWFEGLDRQGLVKGASPLLDQVATISGPGGRSVTDGPFPEAKEAIGGYVLLKVNSMEEAVAIARTNPMLNYGLTTEVRPIATSCPSIQRARQKLAELAAAV
jgi:hypothetical protein